MATLGAILILIGAGACYIAKQDSKRETEEAKKAVRICVIIAIIGILGGVVCLFASSPAPKSKWDSLSDEEQEWYERNYGDGKMDDINDAIDNYKGY